MPRATHPGSMAHRPGAAPHGWRIRIAPSQGGACAHNARRCVAARQSAERQQGHFPSPQVAKVLVAGRELLEGEVEVLVCTRVQSRTFPRTFQRVLQQRPGDRSMTECAELSSLQAVRVEKELIQKRTLRAGGVQSSAASQASYTSAPNTRRSPESFCAHGVRRRGRSDRGYSAATRCIWTSQATRDHSPSAASSSRQVSPRRMGCQRCTTDVSSM